MQVRYAYISQKGYHPSKVNWVCQDECVVLPNYLGRGDNLFMGVFDGHGIVGEGDLAARKAKEMLPRSLEEAMRTTGKGLEQGKTKAAICNLYVLMMSVLTFFLAPACRLEPRTTLFCVRVAGSVPKHSCLD